MGCFDRHLSKAKSQASSANDQLVIRASYSLAPSPSPLIRITLDHVPTFVAYAADYRSALPRGFQSAAQLAP